MGKLNVAVLMGGKSSEREVSLSTGRMILGALNPAKYNAIPIDTAYFGDGCDSSPDILPLDHLIHPIGNHPKPDVVFIALHGKFGEDGTIQGMLELLDLPYVGSGVLASALAMDKVMTQTVLRRWNIPVPKSVPFGKKNEAMQVAGQVIHEELGYPVVVKPSRQGSTIGLSIVESESQLAEALELAFSHDSDVLVEEFIYGKEITCAVLGNDEPFAFPLIEIVPKSGFYDYHSKYTPGATEEIVPARIPEDVTLNAQKLAIEAHRVLGCRGMSRTDIIVRDTELFVLEVNTIPGMTPTSLLPLAAKAAGIEFTDLLDKLIGFALERG